jgi:hypothetical protein
MRHLALAFAVLVAAISIALVGCVIEKPPPPYVSPAEYPDHAPVWQDAQPDHRQT